MESLTREVFLLNCLAERRFDDIEWLGIEVAQVEERLAGAVLEPARAAAEDRKLSSKARRRRLRE